MFRRIPLKRVGKWLLVVAFVATIATVGYMAVEEAFYPNRVKVTVVDATTDNPIKGKKVIFRELECSPQPCEPVILAEGRTDFFGNIRLTTKQLNDSFEVVVEGYQNDGPWQKRPGSLFFTRNYADRDFYSANLANTDLRVILSPAQQ